MGQKFIDSEIHEQAALFALGALGQHEARATEAMIEESASPELLELVESLRSVVGWMGLGAQPVEPSAALRLRLLAGVQPPETTHRDAPLENSGQTAEFIVVRESEEGWKHFAEGVFFKELFVNRQRGTTTTLLRILPGGRVPAHRHSSIEEIFVVKGDCQINNDTLGPGDYRCAQAGTSDRILTSKRGTTVLVVGPTALELL